MADRDKFLHCRMSPNELELLDHLALKFGVVGRAGIVRLMATHFNNMPAPGMPAPEPEATVKPKRTRKAKSEESNV